jgi:hypothetical protein
MEPQHKSVMLGDKVLLEQVVAISEKSNSGLSGIPWDANWSREYELWLEFLRDKGQLDRYLPRLTKARRAEAFEAIDEVKAAYFLDRVCGFEVCEWEPTGRDEKVGEFSIEAGGVRIFCEVKSPGWEREMVRLHGEHSPRLSEPKYQDGEAGSFDNTEDIREAVTRAYKKFPDNQCCLLIISNDLQVSPLKEASPGGIPLSINRALYDRFNDKDGCFTSPLYAKCGGVFLLDVDQLSAGVTYAFQLHANPNAIAPLPGALSQRLDEIGKSWTRPKNEQQG